jgi:hypothetical protein
MNHTQKIHVNKTTTTDHKFPVGLVLIATTAILTIGLTYTTDAHAQVDCSTNPDDPSCQGIGQGGSSSNHIICKIIVAGGAIILGHPELSPLGQVICEP